MKTFVVAMFSLFLFIENSQVLCNMDQNAKTCCAYLGKTDPGFMAMINASEAKTAYTQCFNTMKTIVSQWGFEQIEAISKAVGTTASEDCVKSVANHFNSNSWDSQMIVTFSKNIGFPDSQRNIYVMKITQIGDKAWWNKFFEYLATTKDDTIRYLIHFLADHRDYRDVFDKYLQWAQSKTSVCYISNLELIFPLLAAKQTSNIADHFKIYDSFCPYEQNGGHINTNIQWTTKSLSFAFTQEKIKLASIDDLALFLDSGTPATEALRIAKNAGLDWKLETLFTDIIIKNEPRLSKSYAMASAIEMGMTRKAFNAVIEAARAKGRINTSDFYHYLYIMKHSGLKLTSKDKDLDVANFFVTAFLYQRKEQSIIKREDALDIVHFVNVCFELKYSIVAITELIDATSEYKIKIKVLSRLTLPAMNIPNENILIESMAQALSKMKTALCISAPHCEVLATIKLFVKLGITDEAIWQRVSQLNETKEVLKPYEFVKMHKRIADLGNQGNADNAIKYFFENENIKQCEIDVVESIAKYNIAIRYALTGFELQQLYNIACSTALSKAECCGIIDLARENRSSLAFLKNSLLP